MSHDEEELWHAQVSRWTSVFSRGCCAHHRSPPPVELGTWADWFNAAGTYLAVGGAVFVGVVGLRSYKTQHAATERQLAHQAADEQRRLERERRDQASKVALWFYRGTYRWGVNLVNSSGLPVFRMTIAFFSQRPAFAAAIDRHTQGPIEPGVEISLTNALGHLLRMHAALNMDPSDLTIAAVYTDAAGVRWRRDGDGLLQEVPKGFDFDPSIVRIHTPTLPVDHEYLERKGRPLADYPPPS